jgi:hypothetical protein
MEFSRGHESEGRLKIEILLNPKDFILKWNLNSNCPIQIITINCL